MPSLKEQSEMLMEVMMKDKRETKCSEVVIDLIYVSLWFSSYLADFFDGWGALWTVCQLLEDSY